MDESTPSSVAEDTAKRAPETTENEADANVKETETTESTPEQSADSETETEAAGKPKETDETKGVKEKLIAGKFKSVEELEKAYKSVEKVIAQKAEAEKQLAVYRKQEEDARILRETEARQQGYSTIDEQQLDLQIREKEFLAYCDALDVVPLDDEARNTAVEALRVYQGSQGRNQRALQEAMRCFPAEVVAKIASDVAIFKNERVNEFKQKQDAAKQGAVRAKIDEIKASYPELLKNKETAQMTGLALHLTGGDLDIPEFKRLFDGLKAAYRKEWDDEQAAAQENTKTTSLLNAPTGVGANQTSGSKWLTKEQFDALSVEEMEARQDQINEQIAKEKAGQLPPELIKYL